MKKPRTRDPYLQKYLQGDSAWFRMFQEVKTRDWTDQCDNYSMSNHCRRNSNPRLAHRIESSCLADAHTPAR